MYVVLRAVNVGFTHDESFSYLHFALGRSYAEILLDTAPNAGDHMLNTPAMKAIGSAFGRSEFALQLLKHYPLSNNYLLKK